MKLPPKQWKFDGDQDFSDIVRAASTLVNTWRTSSDERVMDNMASAVRVLERELDAAADSAEVQAD